MERWPFERRDRVRFGDLDARGHLNNVALLEFFEAARILYLREIFPEMDPTDPGARDVILAAQQIDYRAPAGLDDELRTRVRPARIERSSFNVEFAVDRDGTVIADGHGVYVGFDYDAGAARPLARGLSERLTADT